MRRFFSQRNGRQLEHLLILDFESTCDRPKQITPQEIIEIPCINLRAEDQKVLSQFHSYVRPNIHPTLTSFCTELTGIVQTMVDDQPLFADVFAQFQRWLAEQELLQDRWAFVTFGDWDLKIMLPSQCRAVGLSVPDYCNRWVNAKKMVYNATGQYPSSLPMAMQLLGLQQKGRLHSGIDDVKNICSVVGEILNRGQSIYVTGRAESQL